MYFSQMARYINSAKDNLLKKQAHFKKRLEEIKADKQKAL